MYSVLRSDISYRFLSLNVGRAIYYVYIIIRHITRNATSKPRSKLEKFQISTADYMIAYFAQNNIAFGSTT